MMAVRMEVDGWIQGILRIESVSLSNKLNVGIRYIKMCPDFWLEHM